MPIHLTLLKPGPGHHCGADDVLVELSPTDSLENDRAYWSESGESPDIVVSRVPLDVSEEVADYIDDLRSRDEPEILEEILTAAFNLGRAFQNQ